MASKSAAGHAVGPDACVGYGFMVLARGWPTLTPVIKLKFCHITSHFRSLYKRLFLITKTIAKFHKKIVRSKLGNALGPEPYVLILLLNFFVVMYQNYLIVY